jgi:hypothetical protein
MARYKHDVFISYSHLDDLSVTDEPGWVSQFRKALVAELSRRLGRDVEQTIWRDDRLNGQHAFDRAVQEAIENTAVMLALCSAAYLSSVYCTNERQRFVAIANAGPGLYVGDRSRLLPLWLMKLRREQLPHELASLFGYAFYSTSTQGSDRILDPSSPLFAERVQEVAVDVADVLEILDQREPLTNVDPVAAPT